MICPGCGGLVGRDCFNPVECQWISQRMEADYAAQQEYEAHAAREYEAHIQQMEEQHLAEQAGFDPIALGM